jgi:hypothetical protein
MLPVFSMVLFTALAAAVIVALPMQSSTVAPTSKDALLNVQRHGALARY